MLVNTCSRQQVWIRLFLIGEYDSDSDIYPYEFCTVHNSEQLAVHFRQNKIEILIMKLTQLQEQNIRKLLLLFCFHKTHRPTAERDSYLGLGFVRLKVWEID